METVLTLKSTNFNDFVRFLKRISVISDDFLIKNDIWIPKTRCPESRPGKHVINGFPVHPSFKTHIYECTGIRLTSKELGDITGPKGIIQLFQNDDRIWINVGNNSYLIASRIEMPLEDFPEDHESFKAMSDDIVWEELDTETINMIKNGGVYRVSKSFSDVRLVRDLFKLRGVEAKSRAAKYKVHICVSDVNDTMIMLQILCTFEFFAVIHTYACAKYKSPNYDEDFQDI